VMCKRGFYRGWWVESSNAQHEHGRLSRMMQGSSSWCWPPPCWPELAQELRGACLNKLAYPTVTPTSQRGTETNTTPHHCLPIHTLRLVAGCWRRRFAAEYWSHWTEITRKNKTTGDSISSLAVGTLTRFWALPGRRMAWADCRELDHRFCLGGL